LETKYKSGPQSCLQGLWRQSATFRDYTTLLALPPPGDRVGGGLAAPPPPTPSHAASPCRSPRPPPDKVGVTGEGFGGDLVPHGVWLSGEEGFRRVRFQRLPPAVLVPAPCIVAASATPTLRLLASTLAVAPFPSPLATSTHASSSRVAMCGTADLGRQLLCARVVHDSSAGSLALVCVGQGRASYWRRAWLIWSGQICSW
jgi:hypothetical protein